VPLGIIKGQKKVRKLLSANAEVSFTNVLWSQCCDYVSAYNAFSWFCGQLSHFSKMHTTIVWWCNSL